MRHKIPLGRPYFDCAEANEIKKVFASGWVAQGPRVRELEAKVADYLGVKYAVAVANCTCALHLSLLAIGIKAEDEVLVADYTFPATAHAVLHCQAKPVFVDVDEGTYNIDPQLIEAKITGKTKALIPVHTFGQPAQMDEINRIAHKHNLKVIEDAACALGAAYKNKNAGTFGDIGCFSFHGRKGITTGEGGMAVTNDRNFADKIRSLANFGIGTTAWEREDNKRFNIPEFKMLGYNYKMSDIAAAVGIAQLGKLDKIIERKQALARYWDKKLQDIKGITAPSCARGIKHVYQSYVALLRENIDRDIVVERLRSKGIQAQIGTYSCCVQAVYRSSDSCPNSLTLFKRAIALPMYYTLKRSDINFAAKILKQTLEKSKAR
jgi:dTDP-4-amino-4,6-dideoxygalactose transaminase